MKKITISVLICIVLVLGGTTALAEEPNDITTEVQNDSRSKTIEGLFDTYNPTEKETFLNLQEAHQTFHEGRLEIRTEVIQYYAAQISVISGQIAEGTITPADGSEQLQALRSEATTLREDIQVILAQKQIEADSIKSELTALRDLSKNALQQDETSASEIAAYLEQFNTYFNNHIEMDYKYADMVDTILPAY